MINRKILPNIKVIGVDLITLGKLGEGMPVKLEKVKCENHVSVRLNIGGHNVGSLPQKYEEAVEYYWHCGIEIKGEVVAVHLEGRHSGLFIDLYAQNGLDLVTWLKSQEASSPEESVHDSAL